MSLNVPAQPLEHSPIRRLGVIELGSLDDLPDPREPGWFMIDFARGGALFVPPAIET